MQVQKSNRNREEASKPIYQDLAANDSLRSLETKMRTLKVRIQREDQFLRTAADWVQNLDQRTR